MDTLRTNKMVVNLFVDYGDHDVALVYSRKLEFVHRIGVWLVCRWVACPCGLEFEHSNANRK
jgi:hypothetical protein